MAGCGGGGFGHSKGLEGVGWTGRLVEVGGLDDSFMKSFDMTRDALWMRDVVKYD